MENLSMKYVALTLGLLLSIPPLSFADRLPPLVEYYRKEGEKVWNSGKVCRHAVSTLAYIAERRRDTYKVPMYDVVDSDIGHTFFMLKQPEGWYAIDAVLFDGEYRGITNLYDSYDPVRDMRDYSAFTQRDLKSYDGDATLSQIEFWHDEEVWRGTRLLYLDSVQPDIKALRNFVDIGEAALKIYSKEYPHVWDAYQQKVKELKEAQKSRE